MDKLNFYTVDAEYVAMNILRNKLNVEPTETSRFTTGYCHSVYHVKTKADEYVLRITSEENKGFYFCSG